jgi:hypothetical protein
MTGYQRPERLRGKEGPSLFHNRLISPEFILFSCFLSRISQRVPIQDNS